MVRRTPFLLAIAGLLLALPVGAQAEVARGTAHADVFSGTPAADSYWGYGGNDVLRGMNGGDHLFAGRGDDLVVAGPGADNVHGGHGDDRVLAGRGDDRFSGGGGDDYVRGGRGADRLNSGVGNDTVIVSRADGKVDSIDCGSGVDRAVIHSENNEANCEDVTVVSQSQTRLEGKDAAVRGREALARDLPRRRGVEERAEHTS